LSKICIYGLGALFYECYEQIIDMVDVDYLFDINKQGEIVFNKENHCYYSFRKNFKILNLLDRKIYYLESFKIKEDAG
jgi:hypothetical protein